MYLFFHRELHNAMYYVYVAASAFTIGTLFGHWLAFRLTERWMRQKIDGLLAHKISVPDTERRIWLGQNSDINPAIINGMTIMQLQSAIEMVRMARKPSKTTNDLPGSDWD